jgi:hypothetical protein
MDELLKRLAANGFADLEGLQVTGTLPVRQDIVNEVIAALLQEATAAVPATTGTPSATKPASFAATSDLLKLVRKLEVRMAEGKMILDFEIRR